MDRSKQSLLNEITLLKEKNKILIEMIPNITSKHKEFIIKYQGLDTWHKIKHNELKDNLTAKYLSQINNLKQMLNKTKSNNIELQEKQTGLLRSLNKLKTKHKLLQEKYQQNKQKSNKVIQEYDERLIESKSSLNHHVSLCHQQNEIIEELEQKLQIALDTAKSVEHTSLTNRFKNNRSITINSVTTSSDNDSNREPFILKKPRISHSFASSDLPCHRSISEESDVLSPIDRPSVIHSSPKTDNNIQDDEEFMPKLIKRKRAGIGTELDRLVLDNQY